MMRKEKDLSSSSVKSNSRIPKPVSGDNGKVEKQDSSKSRILRSNSHQDSHSTSSTRPIRINRDCLKGIRTTPDRVVKRTRPFIQKLNSDGLTESSNATSQTSAMKPRIPASSVTKPRVPVPRITFHCCVKPSVISRTTTQSTRVLRSHAVSKTTSTVHSSKTNTSEAVAKLSTAVTTSTPTSTRILRSHVLSSRDAVTTNIPKFTWNLRSRCSISKPDCKTAKGDEIKPLRKRGAVKEAEGAKVGKRSAVARDGSLCSKQQKQEAQVVSAEQKETNNNVLEVKQSQPQQQQKLSKSCLEKVESQSLAVSQETLLGGTEHEASGSQQIKTQLEEQQPNSKKSVQAPETKTILAKAEIDILDVLQEKLLVAAKHEEPASQQAEAQLDKLITPASVSELVVHENLEERPLTPEEFEVKILGEVASRKPVEDAEKIPSVQTATALEPALVTKPLVGEQNLEERPVTPADSEVKILGKVTEGKLVQVPETSSSVKTSTPVLAKEFPGETVARAKVEAIEPSLALQGIGKASPPGKDQPSSEEKPASQVEIPPVTKRKCEEKNLCDDIPVVKPRLEEQITLPTSEVASQNYRNELSIVVADFSPVKTTEASSVLEESIATSTKPSKRFPHVETAKLEASKFSESPTAEIQFAGKRKCEEPSDDTRAVKSRLEHEITSKTSEVFHQDCRDGPSIIVADIVPVKTPALVETIDQLSDSKAETSSQSLLVEPATVVKEQLYPVTTSACSKPTRDAREQLSDAEKIPASQDKTLSEFKTHTSLVTTFNVKSESTKRPASLTPLDNELVTKKRRTENGQHKSSPFRLPLQSCSSQTMDIGSVTPAASNQSMEVDASGIFPISFNLNSFPSALNTQNGQNLSEDMELCDSGSSQTIPSPFGINQQSLRTVFGCQRFGFTFASPGHQTGQLRFGINQATSQQFSFGRSQNTQPLFGVSFNQINPPQTFGNIPRAPSFPAGILKQSGNQIFGGVPQPTNQSSPMLENVPKIPSLQTGGFKKISNQQFTFGSVPQPTNQSSPMSGVSFNQAPQKLNIRLTLTNSDGSRRKFIFAKGCRRRNVVKPPVNLNPTANEPQVRFHPNPPQIFGGVSMVQSPSPMESEDVGGLNNQPSNVLNIQNPLGRKNGWNQVFGTPQSTSGQNVNDHSMEECVQTPSLSNGMLPHRTTTSCFAMSIMQTRPTLQRTRSLPQAAVTSSLGIPPSPPLLKLPVRLPLPSSAFAGKRFTNNPTNIPRETSTNISCETSTTCETSTVSREDTLRQPNSQASEVQKESVQTNTTTLHKIFSSVSSLNSSCSNLSDCQSEIDALIDSLSDSISNCSIEDNPKLNDMGKLIEKFKTLSIADKTLGSEVGASEH